MSKNLKKVIVGNALFDDILKRRTIGTAVKDYEKYGIVTVCEDGEPVRLTVEVCK